MLQDLLNLNKDNKRLLENRKDEELGSEASEEMELAVGPLVTNLEFKYYERLGSISSFCVFIKSALVFGMIIYAGARIWTFIKMEF